MATAVKNLDSESLASYLLSEGLSVCIADTFEANGIDDETFVSMTDEHFKEVAPKIVDRVKLKKLQDKVGL